MDAHHNIVSEWIDIYKQGGYDAIVQMGYGTNKSELKTHAASIENYLQRIRPAA